MRIVTCVLRSRRSSAGHATPLRLLVCSELSTRNNQGFVSVVDSQKLAGLLQRARVHQEKQSRVESFVD